jgi:hypothetical protein
MGFYNAIDAQNTGYRIMNPTFLELPRWDNISHDFLIIARTPHISRKIKGKDYRLARQVAMFANLTYSKLGRPVLEAGKWSKLLVEDFGEPEHHCEGQPHIDRYIGPEDMKLFWTQAGEPLLIFTHQVKDDVFCQGQFIIDARAAVPELEPVLGQGVASSLPPIRFQYPKRLYRQPSADGKLEPQHQREKNWAPVQSPFNSDSELLFMVEPGKPFRLTSNDSLVEPIIDTKGWHSSIKEPFPPGVPLSETWHSAIGRTCVHDAMLHEAQVHQSTPMLSLTLCNRGACERSTRNTVALGMVQRRYDRPAAPYTWYDRRIAVYEAEPPYRMLSVSKKLTYHGETDGTYIWTGSMTYRSGTRFPPSNHGFLDDEIWLGFGVGDAAAGWLDISASELVVDHYLCQGYTPDHS